MAWSRAQNEGCLVVGDLLRRATSAMRKLETLGYRETSERMAEGTVADLVSLRDFVCGGDPTED